MDERTLLQLVFLILFIGAASIFWYCRHLIRSEQKRIASFPPAKFSIGEKVRHFCMDDMVGVVTDVGCSGDPYGRKTMPYRYKVEWLVNASVSPYIPLIVYPKSKILEYIGSYSEDELVKA
jgi:hypothetical protein